MNIVWTSLGIAGLVAGLIAWMAAIFILRTTPHAIVRRRLALLLFAEGMMIITSFAGPPLWIGDESTYRSVMLLHAVNDGLIVALYLPTLAAVIDSPLVRVFRSFPGILIPVILGTTNAIATLLKPELTWNVVPALSEHGQFAAIPGPINQSAFLLLMLSYFYGLVVTFLAWRRADTAVERRRNGWLALAFGVRDLFWGAVFFMGVAMTIRFAPNPIPVSLENELISLWFVQAAAWGLIAYILLLAYGIATEHLFDIDLRVKWTLQRGTVAAAYVAVFFVFSEGTAAFLSDQVGTFVGLAATGLLLFALAPIRQLAERLSDTAMPHVHDTPEYRKFRKLEIYGEAFAQTQGNGGPTPVQRIALESLRRELDLSEDETSDFEIQLVGDPA
jgi:hypothetical protein